MKIIVLIIHNYEKCLSREDTALSNKGNEHTDETNFRQNDGTETKAVTDTMS